MRRERPHPGAPKLSLFDTIEGLRHTVHITNTQDTDIATLELRNRQRGRAEQVIRDAKACGLGWFPIRPCSLTPNSTRTPARHGGPGYPSTLRIRDGRLLTPDEMYA